MASLNKNNEDNEENFTSSLVDATNANSPNKTAIANAIDNANFDEDNEIDDVPGPKNNAINDINYEEGAKPVQKDEDQNANSFRVTEVTFIFYVIVTKNNAVVFNAHKKSNIADNV